MAGAAGRVIGIARRPRPRAPMELLDAVEVATGGGLDGDHKGSKFPRRGVTLLAREGWEEAVASLADLAGPVPLQWTVRRANVLVEGVDLPRAKGALLTVGLVRLEVTAETYPCRRMEEAHRGLLKALARDWRGGVTCRVIEGGRLSVGDPIEVVFSPQVRLPKLP